MIDPVSAAFSRFRDPESAEWKNAFSPDTVSWILAMEEFIQSASDRLEVSPKLEKDGTVF